MTQKRKKIAKNFAVLKKVPNFATQKRKIPGQQTAKVSKKLKQGAIAQLVEQRTENPCVPGSIPGGTTFKIAK